MFCPTCGKQVPDGTRFCPTCGTQLPAGAPAAQPAATKKAPFRLTTKMVAAGIAVIAVIAVVAVVIVAGGLLGGRSAEETAERYIMGRCTRDRDAVLSCMAPELFEYDSSAFNSEEDYLRAIDNMFDENVSYYEEQFGEGYQVVVEATKLVEYDEDEFEDQLPSFMNWDYSNISGVQRVGVKMTVSSKDGGESQEVESELLLVNEGNTWYVAG